MNSFDFDDEFFEAAGSAPARSTSGAGPSTRSGPATSTSTGTARQERRSASTSSGGSSGGSSAGSAGGSSGGSSWGSFASALNRGISTASKIGSYAQQAWDFAQSAARGVQQAQQFASSLGLGGARPAQPRGPAQPAPAPMAGAAPQPEPEPAPAQQPATGFDQVASLLSALQQHQIPALPAPQQPAAPAPQPDAFGLLRTILTNPQLQQALQPAAAAVSRNVQLPIATGGAGGQVRDVQIPIGAVLNAIGALSGRVTTELDEGVGEDAPDIPEYLIGDDGNFLVDPASADDRAALVAHLFRLADATEHASLEVDESDVWAYEAGIS